MSLYQPAPDGPRYPDGLCIACGEVMRGTLTTPNCFNCDYGEAER